MKIGVISKGIPVYISDDAPNEHICITGMSGSGKSTRIAEIIESAVQEEKTVIALDLAGMDYKKMEKLNYISAKTDGIGIELFEGNDGPEVIEYITDVMTHICNLKIRQVGAMRNAVQYAIENKSQFSTELDAIDKGLKLQDSGVSESVRHHLWGLVNSHCIRPSSRTLKKNMVNVVTFAELNSGTQKIAAELVLSCMWKKIQRGKSENVMLIIDEFQNYIRKGSVLLEMMRESRKYGVSIVLATQTLEGIDSKANSAVKQAAVQMFFRVNNADTKKVAEMIDSVNADHWKMRLRQLKVGESVVTGMLNIGNREIDDPLVIRSEYKRKEDDSKLLIV